MSQAVIQAVQKVFKSNTHIHDTTKDIVREYLSNWKCLFQHVVYNILSELNPRRIFPAVYFVSTYVSEEWVWRLLSKNKLSKLPEDSQSNFKKLNIECYIERPSVTLCSGKYNVLNDFCYPVFLTFYLLENKSNKICKY